MLCSALGPKVGKGPHFFKVQKLNQVYFNKMLWKVGRRRRSTRKNVSIEQRFEGGGATGA